jgi:hypothetical protein
VGQASSCFGAAVVGIGGGLFAVIGTILTATEVGFVFGLIAIAFGFAAIGYGADQIANGACG